MRVKGIFFQCFVVSSISKKFINCVFQGFGEVCARFFLLQRALIKLDFPTFDLQIKANSGLSGEGQCSNFVPLFINVAELIIENSDSK